MSEFDKFSLLDRVQPTMQARPDELAMLRNFYMAWESLHAIKGDKRNPDVRRAHENAAQALVDAAQPLRILRGQHGT